MKFDPKGTVVFFLVLGGVLYLSTLRRSPAPERERPVSLFSSSSSAPLTPQVRWSGQVLAQSSQGSWLSVDFLYNSDPLEEAKRCVRSKVTTAVTCFAFASYQDYQAANPSSAGSFEHTCFDATWKRDKSSSESGRLNKFKTSGCPVAQSAVPEPAPSPVVLRSPDSLRVTLTVAHEITDAGLFIVGRTNLPDGTVLSTSVSAPERNFMAQGETSVSDGRFRSGPFSMRGRPFTAGQYQLGVTVPFFNAQPPEVRLVLGDHLQYMTGPFTRWMSNRILGKVASLNRPIRIQ